MPYGAAVHLGTGATGNLEGLDGCELTTVADVAVGDLIFVACEFPDVLGVATVTSVSDSAGNTYALLPSKRHSTDGSRYIASAACLGATNAMSTGGTIEFAGSTVVSSFKRITAAKSSGIAASQLDRSSTAEGTSTPWATGSTGGLSDPDEIVFAYAIGRGIFFSGTPANTPGGSYAETYNGYAANIETVVQYDVLSGDASAQNPGGSWDTYSWWLAIAATFMPAAPASGSAVQMGV